MCIVAINTSSISDAFYRGDYKVEEVRYFNYFDPVANSNKFYVAEVDSNNNGEYRFLATYGRVGQNGQTCVKAFSSLTAAMRALETKCREKENKGYVKVEVAAATRGSTKAQNQVDLSGVKPQTTTINVASSKTGTKDKKRVGINVNKITLADNVVDLVTRIYEETTSAVNRMATGSATASGASPIGNLGINTIRCGRQILGEIASILNNTNSVGNVKDAIIQKSINYYRIIPHEMGSKINVDAIALDTQEKLSHEMDILDLYEDALRVLASLGVNASIEQKYNDLHCDLAPVSDTEWKRIERFVRDTALPQHHGYNLKVRNVLSVNQHKAPQLDDHYGNVQDLFHGSRSANIVGILSSHLRLPNTLGAGIHKTGAMFGDGIYFASNSTKSANYSFGSWGGGRNKHNTAYLFVAKVALGRQKIYNEAQSYLRRAPDGYDSVWGKPARNSYLKNNEYIIYRENQCRIGYIVEVEKDR